MTVAPPTTSRRFLGLAATSTNASPNALPPFITPIDDIHFALGFGPARRSGEPPSDGQREQRSTQPEIDPAGIRGAGAGVTSALSNSQPDGPPDWLSCSSGGTALGQFSTGSASSSLA